MMLLALIWVLVEIATGMLYADRPALRVSVRIWLIGGAITISSTAILVLATMNWRLWLVPAILHAYHVINAARFVQQRMPVLRLNSVALRAHLWLALLQAVAIAAGCLGLFVLTANSTLSILAAMQLFIALLLLRSSLHTWRHTQVTSDTPTLTDRALPSLSVLIPARNETEGLRQCLEELLKCDYPKLEIIVFDDNSTNRRTPEIIRSFAHDGVRFITGDELDEAHWLAKNQAYARLAQAASGDVLLFCGVDALFGAQSLRRLVEALEAHSKDMLSVLPLKDSNIRTSLSVLQPMRYYWELCLPRRLFKRPPVLSTCWLVRKRMLERAGGFAAVAHSATPEAYFARQAVVTDAYSFLRSDEELAIRSAKPLIEQYDTSVRIRYPQLHRRIELVALTTLLELVFLCGPIVGLCMAGWLSRAAVFVAIWSVCTGCLLITYYLVAVTTKINSAWLAWLIMPFAFLYDIFIQHTSLYKYEFSRVIWKERDVTSPIMQTFPRLPKD